MPQWSPPVTGGTTYQRSLTEQPGAGRNGARP